MPLHLPPELEYTPERIVRAIGREPVDVYRFLRERFLACEPQDDIVFQFVFRSFYRIDNAGLTDEFKTRYFEIFSAAKETNQVDLESIIHSLFEIPNRKGQPSLQFSFATKLAATVNVDTPIYDAEIAAVFDFRAPYNYKTFSQRLAEYMAFHVDLADFYRSIIGNGQMQAARTMFRKLYGVSEAQVSETKALDFIFWSAGKLSKAPAL
jgi:hypothetical protein